MPLPLQKAPSKITVLSILRIVRELFSRQIFSTLFKTRSREPQYDHISGINPSPRFFPFPSKVRPISSWDFTSTRSPGCRPSVQLKFTVCTDEVAGCGPVGPLLTNNL